MKIAVIIPCLNEEVTVARVVEDCRRFVPTAQVYVLDNGSRDQTAARARAAGAHVIYSPLRGKGHVLRHAFRVIDADYFVMIDGDGTYPVEEAPKLLDLAQTCNYEMVMGARLQLGRREAFRPLHYLGNRLFTTSVRVLFGFPVQDLLTGYRVFSRRFAREVQLLSMGFEIETELTIRAMAQDMAFCEVAIPYVERPAGSHSKLRTFRDGARITRTILTHLRDFKPFTFFAPLALLCLGLGLALPTLATWLQVLSAGLVVLGAHASMTLSSLKLRRRAIPDEAHAQSTRPNLKAVP